MATVNADVAYLTSSNIGFGNETFNDRYATQQSLLSQLPAIDNAVSFAPFGKRTNMADLYNQVMSSEKPSEVTNDLPKLGQLDINQVRSRLDNVNNNILSLFNQGYVWQNAQPLNKYLYPLRRLLIQQFINLANNNSNFYGSISFSVDGKKLVRIPQVSGFENVSGENKSYYNHEILFLLLQIAIIAMLIYYLNSKK